MSVRVTKELVCDLCGSTTGVERWRLIQAKTGRQVSVDLCREDADLPRQVMETFSEKGKRGQLHRRPVFTEREVRAKARGK